MIGEIKMVATRKDVISFIDSISESEFRSLCDLINDYQDRKKAEAEFTKQMTIAEESVKTEGTLTSAEIRASLGI